MLRFLYLFSSYVLENILCVAYQEAVSKVSSALSVYIKKGKKYEKQLSKIYWKKRVLWSDVYFACSIGQVSQDVIEKYILTQG